MKFYYRTVPSLTLPVGSSNPVGTDKPMKHGNDAPKWTNRGRTHLFLIVLSYKVADFFVNSMVQSNPDLIGKKRGGLGQERENQSGERRVHDGTGRKYVLKQN